MKKRRVAVALILLLVGAALCAVRQNVVNSTNVYQLLERNLADHDAEIIKLIQIHQGKYIDDSDKEFKQFSAFFDARLVSVDLRNDAEMSFSFYSIYLNANLKLAYCKSNQIVISDSAVLSDNADELRLEHLGISKDGYIYCKRIKQCWFYCEFSIPT